jgi:hypothetical protein
MPLTPKEHAIVSSKTLGTKQYHRFCEAAGLVPRSEGWAFLHCLNDDGQRVTAISEDVPYLELLIAENGTEVLRSLEIPAHKFPYKRAGWPDEWVVSGGGRQEPTQPVIPWSEVPPEFETEDRELERIHFLTRKEFGRRNFNILCARAGLDPVIEGYSLLEYRWRGAEVTVVASDGDHLHDQMVTISRGTEATAIEVGRLLKMADGWDLL